MDQHIKRSLPNKAVDVIPANFLAIDCFPRLQLMAPLASPPACHVRFRLRSRLLYDRPRGGVADRLIDFASHP
jgi:hypothetical protein